MTVSVREATIDDIEGILDVATDAWYATYGGLLEPSTVSSALDEYYDQELLKAGVDHDEIAFFVASDEGEIIGFASAEQTWADEVELHTIYVHPDRWSEGIGSALFDRVLTWAQALDIDRIACGVLAENAIGIGFFEAVGFVRGIEANAEIAGEIHSEYEYELSV